MNILTFTRLWPNAVEPNQAIFNEHRMRALATLPGFSARTVAPVPFYPPLPFPRRYAQLARVPLCEVRHGLDVEHRDIRSSRKSACGCRVPDSLPPHGASSPATLREARSI